MTAVISRETAEAWAKSQGNLGKYLVDEYLALGYVYIEELKKNDK